MANEIDALLARVDDSALRQDLRAQFDRLQQKRQFGLVFEEHLPERVVLPQHQIRRGTKVVLRTEATAKPSIVTAIANSTATLRCDDEILEVDTSDLVAIAEFGEPIFPGLSRLGSVDRGGQKPAHVVIKGENHHALEALQFTHAGKIDCIYIDPPYNSGARDWKYNNDFVDGEDAYRHSKWLAMMQRRLLLARDLLNPEESALVVTIDEKEYLRLGLLLEQVFPQASIQMVSITINPKGTSRPKMFSRVDEFAFFVLVGSAAIPDIVDEASAGKAVRWRYLRREDDESVRGSRPRQFYPVFVDPKSLRIVDVGDPIAPEVDRRTVTPPDGLVAVFPVREDGKEMEWGLTGRSLMKAAKSGFARATPGHDMQPFILSYLTAPNIKKVETGELVVKEVRADGSKVVVSPAGKGSRPTTVWREPRHSAGDHGTKMLSGLIPGRDFPFPKSVYAIEDTLRLLVGHKPNATVLDFFVGSGTTTHAVARLNRQDGGRRQSIAVTNNEVSDREAKRLLAEGHRPGDPEWEELGIFEQITRPRIESAMAGVTPEGHPVEGLYKFTDEFPMAEGFEENVEFVELTYLDAEEIELDLAFTSIAPLLWMRAGSRGPVIKERTDPSGDALPYAATDVYAVLFDPDEWRSFIEELPETVGTVFVVTDSASVFAGVANELPDGLDVVRLYENYLSTFAINQGGRR